MSLFARAQGVQGYLKRSPRGATSSRNWHRQYRQWDIHIRLHAVGQTLWRQQYAAFIVPSGSDGGELQLGRFSSLEAAIRSAEDRIDRLHEVAKSSRRIAHLRNLRRLR